MNRDRERLYFWVLFSTGLGGVILSSLAVILIATT